MRPLLESDLDLVFSWRNHPNIRKYMFNKDEIKYDEHINWFKKISQNKNHHLLIFEMESVPSGYVSFISQDINSAKWGFYLAPNSQKGTGRYLGETALRYAFEKINLNIVIGEVLVENNSSQKFHERLGFILDKNFQKKIDLDNDEKNYYRYYLTKKKWENNLVLIANAK